MSTTIRAEGFSIFKNHDEPYGSQKKTFTKLFETIRYSKMGTFQFRYQSIQ